MLRWASIFFILALLIAGCDMIPFWGGGNEKPVDIVTYNQVHSGSQGIEVTYLPERPQSTYFIGDSEYDIVLAFEVENKGASDVQNGIISLNYDPLYVTFPTRFINFNAMGRSIYNNKGEKVSPPPSFTGKIFPLKEARNEITINAVACYEYLTEYIFDICIDTDPANIRDVKKACDFISNQKKYSSLSGQGAPVAISKLDQTINTIGSGIETEFIVYIRNVGRGKIYDKTAGVDNLCLHGGAINELSRVTVSAELAGQPLNCDSPITVYDGEDGISNCKATTQISSSEPSYLSSLRVTLGYDYVDTFGKNVILRKQGEKI